MKIEEIIEEIKDTLKIRKATIVKVRDEQQQRAIQERIDEEELILNALEKQIPKLPEHKVHEKYPTLGRNYYCTCGVMFVDFERNGTNYCGNCGQRLR